MKAVFETSDAGHSEPNLIPQNKKKTLNELK